MTYLRGEDFSNGVDLLERLRSRANSPTDFARAGVRGLSRLVASEITTLSLCNLRTGRREVVATPGCALSRAEIETFDRHFHEHPLVHFHGVERRLDVQRISDSLPQPAFRRTGLYNDYYRRIGIHHVIAVPLLRTREWLVSFVLNRTRRDFSDRERELLGLLRPHLARAYKSASSQNRGATPAGAGEETVGAPLTRRERDVLGCLSLGKTDRDIGLILGISPRTVQKHLEHVYPKLGVETRTAAVMRANAGASGPTRPGAAAQNSACSRTEPTLTGPRSAL